MTTTRGPARTPPLDRAGDLFNRERWLTQPDAWPARLAAIAAQARRRRAECRAPRQLRAGPTGNANVGSPDPRPPAAAATRTAAPSWRPGVPPPREDPPMPADPISTVARPRPITVDPATVRRPHGAPPHATVGPGARRGGLRGARRPGTGNPRRAAERRQLEEAARRAVAMYGLAREIEPRPRRCWRNGSAPGRVVCVARGAGPGPGPRGAVAWGKTEEVDKGSGGLRRRRMRHRWRCHRCWSSCTCGSVDTSSTCAGPPSRPVLEERLVPAWPRRRGGRWPACSAGCWTRCR